MISRLPGPTVSHRATAHRSNSGDTHRKGLLSVDLLLGIEAVLNVDVDIVLGHGGRRQQKRVDLLAACRAWN